MSKLPPNQAVGGSSGQTLDDCNVQTSPKSSCGGFKWANTDKQMSYVATLHLVPIWYQIKLAPQPILSLCPL